MAENNSDGENIVGKDEVKGSDEEEEFDDSRGQAMQGQDDDYIEDGSQYLDEDEIDDELGLPPELLAQGLSLDEKRRFYRFKKSHTNIDWEDFLVNKMDETKKRTDLERLQRMTSKAETDTAPVRGRARRQSKPKAAKKGSKKRSKYDDDDDDDDGDDDDDEEDDFMEEEDDFPIDSDSDDLFDSDEDEMISNKRKSRLTKVKKGPKKEKAAKKQRSRLDDYVGPDDDDDDYDNFARDSYTPVVARHRTWRRDDDSEEEGDDEDLPQSIKRKAVDASTIKEPTINDYYLVQVRRDFIIRYQKDPYFKESCVGCFVRYFKRDVGSYFMCEIVDVIKRAQYAVPGGGYAEVSFIVAIGGVKLPRPIKVSDISNSRLYEAELTEYLSKVKLCKKRTLSCGDLNKLRQKFKLLTYRSLTADEVQKNVDESSTVTLSVDNLELLYNQAMEAGDMEDMERIEKKIAIARRIDDEKRAIIQSAGMRIAEVNRRNRESNLQKDIENGRRKRLSEQAAANKASEMLDRKNMFSAHTTDDSIHMGAVSIDAIRNRFLQTYGVDPLRHQGLDKRQQYLNKVCAELPPLGSAEREEFRAPAISLTRYRELRAGGI